MLRGAGQWASLLAFATSHAARAFTADVTPAGLCADGRVRIGNAPGKGLGAFAVHALSPTASSFGLVRGEVQIGEYRGEVYTLAGLQARYGKNGIIAEESQAWNRKWAADRNARSVGITGGYVMSVSDALDPWSEVLYVDAEDTVHAMWTRYINHSEDGANLAVRSSNGLCDSRTTLRLVIIRGIEAGGELLINYGPGYTFDVAVAQ